MPATVVVPPGATSATFPISSNAAAPPTGVQITAAVGNAIRSANISVNSAPPAGPSLSSVSFSPASVTGGSATTGTVKFSGATDGRVVQLSSSNPAVVQVPSETSVDGGQASGAFPVTTAPVSTTTTATVTANWFGIRRTATVTVVPGPAAAPDKVTIKTARWSARLLKIEATDSNPNAILSVYTSSGSFMFNLTNNGGGRFSDQRGWVTNPERVTVRSNLGGSDSAATSK